MRDLLYQRVSTRPPARLCAATCLKASAFEFDWPLVEGVLCPGTGTLRLRLVHTKSRICIRLSVVTRFIRLHPGAQKGNAANYCSLFEPHYKQNLYTNPKRTAKSQINNTLFDNLQRLLFKKVSVFKEIFLHILKKLSKFAELFPNKPRLELNFVKPVAQYLSHENLCQ